MPVHKTKNGYKWGKTGKEYPTKKQAERQARAIYANGYKGINEEHIERCISESVDKVLKKMLKQK